MAGRARPSKAIEAPQESIDLVTSTQLSPTRTVRRSSILSISLLSCGIFFYVSECGPVIFSELLSGTLLDLSKAGEIPLDLFASRNMHGGAGSRDASGNFVANVLPAIGSSMRCSVAKSGSQSATKLQTKSHLR